MTPALPPESTPSRRRGRLRFLSAQHRRSLRGTLAQYVATTTSEAGERAAEESAWAEDAARDDEAAVQGDT